MTLVYKKWELTPSLHGADVACWAKKCAYSHSTQLFFSTRVLKNSSVQCDSPATTLRKLQNDKTNIFKILKLKIFKTNYPPAGLQKVPSHTVES
jgi:hypothetical protein